MKKLICCCLTLILFVGALGFAVHGAEASASLTGPDGVRIGETITLTFQISGKGIFGISGSLQYDSSQLELKSVESKLEGDWMLEVVDNTFVAYDNKLETPIDKSTAVFTAKFRVKGTLKLGDKISVKVGDLVVSEGEQDTNLSAVQYSATVVPPLSKIKTLDALTVSNASINPIFSKDITEYTAEVPFSVEKLKINAKATDSKAKVTVDHPELKPGDVTVITITVTAENGDRKVYTISVKRGQDPNYVPSGEKTLSGISVDGFLLSPVFDPSVTSYVIWLPYEVDSVNVSGTASSSLAVVKVLGGDVLEAGKDNEIQVICIAENGDQMVYTIIAKRAASHETEPTTPPTEPTLPSEPTTPPTEPTQPQTPTSPSEPDDSQQDQPTPSPMKPWMLIAVASLCLALGLAIGLLIGRKLKD